MRYVTFCASVNERIGPRTVPTDRPIISIAA